MGRKPYQFTEERIATVEKMAGLGLTIERMSGVLGISARCFHKHQSENEVLRLAIERGRGNASMAVGQSLFERAVSGDIQSIRWWETTRDCRSDRVHQTVDAKIATPEEELEELARLKAMLAEHGIVL